MTRLILRYPNNVVREVEFEQPKYRIGSAEDNDLVIDQEGVSPHQAEIEETAGAFSIVDVSEDKSTTVNGKTIERSNLNYGDRISLGPVVALFYPVKKSGFGAKAKLFMYIGAGALVIVLSIVLIFYFMSRQISSAVTRQLGEGLIPEEIATGIESALPEVEEKIDREKRPLFSRVKEAVPEKRTVQVLVLPDPTSKEIEERTAVAVPRGLGRLFFRKIPLEVAAGVEEAILDEVPGEAFAEEKEEGILRSMLSPVARLLQREPQASEFLVEYEEEAEEVEETVFEEREAPEPEAAPVEEEQVRAEDIDRVVNPLTVLTAMDIPELRDEAFEEEPIYKEEEVAAIEETGSLTRSPLSEAEAVNIDIVWRYPEGVEKIEPILRSGAVLMIDRRGSASYLFGTKEGVLLSVNSTSGEELFLEDLGKPFYDPIVEHVDGDRVKDIILVFEDGDITALTAELERIWYYDGEDSITSLPALFDVNGDGIKDIVFATYNMDVVALDGASGFELWRFFDSESEIIHSPVAADANGDSVHDVLLCTQKGYLYLLDGKTGWTLWKNTIYGRPAGSPLVSDLDGDKVDEIVVLTRNGLLSSYRADGKLLFTWELEGGFSTAPSIGDTDGDGINEIVLVDSNGVLRSVEGRTRAEEWVFESDEVGPLGRVALSDLDGDGGSDVIFCTYSGALYVLDGRSGSVVAVFNYGSHVLATPIVVDSNKDRVYEIFTGTYSGEVYALNVADIKTGFLHLKRSSWETRNHDYRNTGYARQYYLKNPWK